MSRYRLVVVLFLVVFLNSCSKNEIDSEASFENNTNIFYFLPVENLEIKPIEEKILKLINNHRVSSGLSILQLDIHTQIQAFQHSSYMASVNEMSHDYFFQRNANLKQCTNAFFVAENVGYGYSSANSVVNAWLNSESHKAVIEGTHFTHFNVNVEANSQGELFFTLICIQK